jgi:translation initiation factor IF-3
VEVSPQAEPPVARIIDWGKYVYQKQKQQNKKKQKSQDLKQVRMGLKIGSHDFDIKLRKIREFLEAGHQVRISAFFRGREMAHKDLGYVLLDRVLKTIEDVAVVEQEPQMAGRYLSLQVRKK